MDMFQQLAAVCGVLLLLGGTLWLLKQKRWAVPKKGGRQLEVIERVMLGPQHTLALVRVNSEVVLVGLGPGVCEIRNVAATS